MNKNGKAKLHHLKNRNVYAFLYKYMEIIF